MDSKFILNLMPDFWLSLGYIKTETETVLWETLPNADTDSCLESLVVGSCLSPSPAFRDECTVYRIVSLAGI